MKQRTGYPAIDDIVERGKWRYVQNRHTGEVVAGPVVLKPHWRGLGNAEEIRAVMRQVVRDHEVATRLREVDASAIGEIRKRRSEMVFPSGVPTKEWLDIDMLLEALESNQIANVQLVHDKQKAAALVQQLVDALRSIQNTARGDGLIGIAGTAERALEAARKAGYSGE